MVCLAGQLERFRYMYLLRVNLIQTAADKFELNISPQTEGSVKKGLDPDTFQNDRTLVTQLVVSRNLFQDQAAK